MVIPISSPHSVVLVLLAVPMLASGDERPTARLQSRFKAELIGGTTIGFRPPQVVFLPLQLTFSTPPDKEERIKGRDLHFALLDSEGEEIEGAIVQNADELEKEVLLKGPTTILKPTVLLGPAKLKAGQAYFFVTVIRSRTALVKFTTEGTKPGKEVKPLEILAFPQDSILRARLVTEKGKLLEANKDKQFLVVVAQAEILGTHEIDKTDTLQLIDGAKGTLRPIALGLGVATSHVKYLSSRTFTFFDVAEQIHMGQPGTLILVFEVPKDIQTPVRFGWKSKEHPVKLVIFEQWKKAVGIVGQD